MIISVFICPKIALFQNLWFNIRNIEVFTILEIEAMRNILSFDLLNQQTRLQLRSAQYGYVDKTHDIEAEAQKLLLSVSKVRRFDLGENPDGCSPMVVDYLHNLDLN